MRNKIKVAFCLQISNGWLGGVNYYKNLINIIVKNPQINIEPIVFVPRDYDKNIAKDFPEVEFVETGILEGRRSFRGIIAGIERRLRGHSIMLERLLESKNIDVLSHASDANIFKNVPVMGWIPDFQHKYLPEFFSKEECIYRDKIFLKMSKMTDCVLLSSNDALKDYKKFYADYVKKAAVYQFVVPFEACEYDANELRNKYDLKQEFFYCPNQFWQHKNHKIIVDALNVLKDDNVQVVCSGNTGDYRNASYFNDLMAFVKEYGLEKKFKVLGVIPYSDVQALMQECTALLNPSLFEGWNTMVEEGKSLGKRMILSDLDVHLEQNAEGAVYFNRNEAADLARAMQEVLADKAFDEKELREKAGRQLKQREKIAAENYREILEFTIGNFHKKKIVGD